MTFQLNVHRKGFPNVKANEEPGPECSYARIETWAPHDCGYRTVTRRIDMSYGCIRCGATREKGAA